MADDPNIELKFDGECLDCGRRIVEQPPTLPDVGDDFDWLVRDYDGFRLFMMEELAARLPQRKRWTPADVEVALVEVLATLLDQLSDMLDRISAEAFLETARRPQSVRALLKMIGYDAIVVAKAKQEGPFAEDVQEHPDDPRDEKEKFDQYWLDNPTAMDAARLAGPRSIHTQHRMVTVDDYSTRLEEHPLVLRAQAKLEWGGSWLVIRVAVILWNRSELDGIPDLPDSVQEEVEEFHSVRQLEPTEWDGTLSFRTILRHYLDTYRMVGQEVYLQEAVEVGIVMSLAITVNKNYYQSEVRYAVEQALGRGPGGFFEPGRLKFGEDLFAGDIFQTLMALDGVDNVCLNRFKRLGKRYEDQSENGRIQLDGLEVAVCDNDPADHARGYFYLQLSGGRKG